MWFKKKRSRPLSDFLDTRFEEALVKSEDIYKPLAYKIPELKEELIPLEFDNVGKYKRK